MVGYYFPVEYVESLFRLHTEEVSHLEDRFDAKTGEKIAPLKVIDCFEEEYYEIDGEEVADWELMDVLADKLGCVWSSMSKDDVECVAFGVSLPTSERGEDLGRLTVSESFLYEDVCDAEDNLEDLAEKLGDLGLDVDAPQVFIAGSVN